MYSNLTSIQQAIDTGESLQEMAQVYGEIALGRLSRIRVKIEKNRAFAAKLADLFAKVRKQTVANPMPGSDPDMAGVGVYLVLTSREKFFTGLENNLWRFFDRTAQGREKFDLLVIGPGKSNPSIRLRASHQAKSIVLERDLPTSTELSQLAAKVLVYDRVMVFYPRFRTLASQEMVFTEISGEPSGEPASAPLSGATASPLQEVVLQRAVGQAPSTPSAGSTVLTTSPLRTSSLGAMAEQELYILEPEASLMLTFFRQQVARVLLEQTFLEAELARTAARMIFMTEVQGRAKDYIVRQHRMLVKERYEKREKQILEISLSFLWAKKTLDNLS